MFTYVGIHGEGGDVKRNSAVSIVSGGKEESAMQNTSSMEDDSNKPSSTNYCAR